jgi:hypothetical protein
MMLDAAPASMYDAITCGPEWRRRIIDPDPGKEEWP